MALSDEQLERYARQVIVPGIGEQGQQRLLQARVLLVGTRRGVAQAASYLRAAGVTVMQPHEGSSARADLAVVAGADAISDDTRSELLSSGIPLCWYVLEEHGFTAGRHPHAPLPAAGTIPAGLDETLHDAAACDAAAVACAWIAGLEVPAGPFACEVV